jgi:GNAT superfamily N-acetyltransferase
MSPSPAKKPKAPKINTKVKADEVDAETQGSIVATIDGEPAGLLDFVDYAGTTQIRLVFTEPEHRRKGVATAMLAALREHFPASKPAQFYMNADGRGLRDARFEDFKRPTV